MRQEPKLFSSDRGTPAQPQDGFRVEPRQVPRARYDDDDDRPHRRRGGFPWKLMIVLVVLAAVAYGGWKVWGMFGQQVAGGGEVPLFTASVDPFKHRPDDPGGIVVPYEDSTVFGGTLGGAEQGDELEQLLPEPEEPIAMQPDEADAAPAAAEEGVIDVGVAPVGDVEAPEEGAEALFSADQIDALVDQAMSGGEGALPLPQEKPAAPAAPETTISVVEEEADPTAPETAAPTGTLSLDDIAASLGVSGDAGGASTGATTAAGESTTQAPAAEETTSAAVESTEPAASDGASWVQIAAYLSREDAAAAWQRLAANQADLLASVEARVMETIVAGTSFHRLQVGSFASAADAQRLCDALRQRQIDCMVVGP